MQIVMTAAGLGSRFKNYSDVPKPFIKVNGKCMWEHAITPFLKYGNPTFVFQQAHRSFFDVPDFDHNVVWIDTVTEGAAETAYIGSLHLDTFEPVCFIDSDGVIEFENWDYSEFGGTFTTNSLDPKHSFVKLDDNGFITEIREKDVISEIANTGHYWWHTLHDFQETFEYAKKYEIKIRNEYYMAPMYNIAIANGFKFKPLQVNNWNCWGTPTDLNDYLNN